MHDLFSHAYVDRTYISDFTLYLCRSRCGSRGRVLGVLSFNRPEMAHVWFTPLAPKEGKEATARNKSSPKAPRTPRPEKPAKVAKAKAAKAAKAKVQPVPSKITKKATPR